MIQKLYVISVVVIRAAGLYAVGTAVLALLVTGFATGTGALHMLLMSVGSKLIGGVALWLLAKPAAKAITSGLDENSA